MDQPLIQRSINRTAGATGTQAPAAVTDTAGYDRVKITTLIGDIAASGAAVVKAQHGNLADGSDMADIASSGISFADGADENKFCVHDIIRPIKRYVRSVIVKSGGNVEVDGQIVELGSGMVQVESIPANCKGYKQLGSPASGTA